MEFKGIVCVRPGNTVNISLEEDPARARQAGFEKAEMLLAADPKGFNPETMKTVKPQPTFKPGTTEHWPDTGLHVTVALDGENPYRTEDGTPDKVTEEMKKVEGREMRLTVDPTSWEFLEGNPANDPATKLVFYLAAFLDAPSNEKVADLRTELGLGPVKTKKHLSLAGVAPRDDDFPAFRKRFCRPRPATGVPPAYHQLIDLDA